MPEWSVDLEMLHALGVPEPAEALVGHVMERLKGRGPSGSWDARTLSVRFNVLAPTPEEALAKAARVFRRALAGAGYRQPVDVVRAELETVEELDRQLAISNVPELVGVAEVAAALGVSRQRASDITRRRNFPRPLVKLAAGPIWDRHAVARFVEAWPRRRTGRPRLRPSSHA